MKEKSIIVPTLTRPYVHCEHVSKHLTPQALRSHCPCVFRSNGNALLQFYLTVRRLSHTKKIHYFLSIFCDKPTKSAYFHLLLTGVSPLDFLWMKLKGKVHSSLKKSYLAHKINLELLWTLVLKTTGSFQNHFYLLRRYKKCKAFLTEDFLASCVI